MDMTPQEYQELNPLVNALIPFPADQRVATADKGTAAEDFSYSPSLSRTLRAGKRRKSDAGSLEGLQAFFRLA